MRRDVVGGCAGISGNDELVGNVDQAQGCCEECEVEKSRDSGVAAERSHIRSFGGDFRPIGSRLLSGIKFNLLVEDSVWERDLEWFDSKQDCSFAPILSGQW